MEFHPAMMHDSVWFDRPKYEEAREHYELYLTNNLTLQVSKPHEDQGLLSRATTAVAQAAQTAGSALINEINEIRSTIQQSLTGVAHQVQHAVTAESDQHIDQVDSENKQLRRLIMELTEQMKKLDARVTVLEASAAKAKELPPITGAAPQPPTKKAKVEEEDDDDDEDVDDLFDSDNEIEETEEEKAAAEKRKAELVAKYNEKKSKKPALIAKSSILLDVKPWDDETDMKEMERLVRTIEMDGLLWGAAKLVPLAYGIKKLQINCVVEDDKVGTDDLEEKIVAFEDLVQSVDVAAFNKI